jgi:hypothetical protein
MKNMMEETENAKIFIMVDIVIIMLAPGVVRFDFVPNSLVVIASVPVIGNHRHSGI